MTTRRGRRIALITGICVLVTGLAAIVWYRAEIRASYALWVNFERLPDNARGYAEYRHRATGMPFVRLPGGKVFVPTYDPPRVEIGPFLIAKQKVSAADWKRILGQDPRSSSPRPDWELVSLETCEEFCIKAGLSLPTDAQMEHAWDSSSIPDSASNLKPLVQVHDSGASMPPASRVRPVWSFVHAGFHPSSISSVRRKAAIRRIVLGSTTRHAAS